MTRKKRRLILTITLAVVFLLLALLFGIYDLQISQAVANVDSAFGLALEQLGVLISPFLAVLSGMVLLFYAKAGTAGPTRRFKLVLGGAAILGGLGYAALTLLELPPLGQAAVWLVSLGCFAAVWLWLSRREPARLENLFRIAVTAIFTIVTVMLVVQLLKLCWGRLRFRDMGDSADFTRWFLPQGFTGSASFPSGHTANAATLWVLTMFVPLTEKRWQKALCWIVPAAAILILAVSRVMVGAHYASDVLFGGGIAVLLFYPVRRVVEKYVGPVRKPD